MDAIAARVWTCVMTEGFQFVQNLTRVTEQRFFLNILAPPVTEEPPTRAGGHTNRWTLLCQFRKPRLLPINRDVAPWLENLRGCVWQRSLPASASSMSASGGLQWQIPTGRSSANR